MNFPIKPRANFHFRDSNKILYLLVFMLALVVSFIAIDTPLFTDDQGLYASIAKNLLYGKDFFYLFTYNQDWLDKPHFPFWMILLSFKLFGVSAWAYRLPALLFFIIGLIYTFLFTRKYYGREIAATAVLILMTALSVQLSNTDIRAEPYLMALIMGSLYHISNLTKRLTFADLVLAALFSACAIMTKGIFVLVAIYGGLIGQLLFTNEWKQLFKFKWLLLIALTAVFTLPEIYALYQQFDLHPEKTVFGAHHISGIKWFLWDSQFGRFINSGPIVRKTSGSIFFYIHTLLWAFAPWCLLFYYAIVIIIRNIYKRVSLPEYFSVCGGLLLLLLFSFSRFQLPFYVNAILPLFSIITAAFCYKQLGKYGNIYRLAVQWLFVISLPITVIIINFLLKPAHDWFFGLDCLLLGTSVILIPSYAKSSQKKAFFFSCISALFLGFYLNTIFYKVLTPYKGEIKAASYVNLRPFDNFPVYTLKAGNNIFQFYCEKPVNILSIEQFKNFKPKAVSIFFANQQSLNYLIKTHADFRLIKSFVDYPQENILPNFIDKAARFKVLGHVYLITK